MSILEIKLENCSKELIEEIEKVIGKYNVFKIKLRS